jgi:hypothetical protein
VSSGIVEPASSGSQGTESQSAQGQASRSKLVQRLLSASSALPAFVNDLLTTQAVIVAGTEAAGFLIEKGQEQNAFSLRAIAHVRPDNAPDEIRQQAIAAFIEIVKPCVLQNKDGAIEVGQASEGELQYCLVTLLRNEGQVVAVSAVITRCRDLERAQQRLVSMQLVAGYFDLYTLRRSSETSRVTAQNHQHSLQLATAVGTADGFAQSASNFCNELATRTGATRVSMGWVKGDGTKIKVVALSHTEQFDKKQDVVIQIEKVMEECLDQEEIVQFDPEGELTSQNVTRAAAAFSRGQANVVVMSLPLRRQSEIVGVVTLEFDTKRKLPAAASEGLSVAVELLGPQLYDRYENDRWLITKVGIATRETAKLAIGPKHMLAKCIIVLSIATILFVALFKMMYHVAAPFTFATVEKRDLCSPYEGYIGEIPLVLDEQTHTMQKIHAGLPVKKGQVLLSMDTTDIRLQQAEAKAKRDGARTQAQKAYAEGKTADAKIYETQGDEADANYKLASYKLDHAVLKAPYDGEILKFDYEDKAGAPVKEGEVLFEVAQKGNLRVQVNVADRDIQFVKPGAHATLATSTLPGDSHDFTVDHVVPLGEPKEGNNVFTVYGNLEKVDPAWRPGLTGEARIDVEKKSLAWIWTHRLVDFIRLKAWM